MTIGETITLEDLERDPYPSYARLRDEEPVSWVPAVGLWLVTRFDDVRQVVQADGSLLSWMLRYDVEGDRMTRAEIVANTS